MIDLRTQAADALKWARLEADSIMEEFGESSPLALAAEIMQKRDTFDGGAAFASDVADVLRERQAEWLKGRRWPEEVEAIPGAPKLTRTSEHAQRPPEDDLGA